MLIKEVCDKMNYINKEGGKNMSNDKKFVESITSRDVDFAQWYTDVVREAKLCNSSSLKLFQN